MRLLIVSLILALVLLLPALADLRQFTLPNRGLIGIPAVFLDYGVVVLHEMGHTITRWLFGYLVIPHFEFNQEFEQMAKAKVDFPQNGITVWAIYIAIVAAFFVALAKRHNKLAGGIATAFFVHAALNISPGHMAFIFYMGHGIELLAASYLIVHAARGEAVGGWIRQYLCMIIGLYLMGKNVILALGLGIGSAAMREAYAHQRGVHVGLDFMKIAKIFGETTQTVAFYSMGITVLVAAIIVYLAVWLPATERLGSIK